MKTVAVIGTGYVGLTTGAYLSHLGHRVVCADVDETKIWALCRGEVPIVEAGLKELVSRGLEEGRLSFVVGAVNAVADAEFVFLCLPTPQGADGSADVGYVLSAAADIGPHLRPRAVVINKSTVPIGTAHEVAAALGRDDVSVVSNPEFLREGTAVQDSLHPDRIVIASDDPQAMTRVAELFEAIDAPVVMTDPASAEMIKYASNALLVTRLSFVNAIATLCERVGADVRDVLLGMGHDRRIGFEFLKPGPGWGGSCFPKDTRALLRIAEDCDFDFTLLRGAVEGNRFQFDSIAGKVERMVGGSLAGLTVAAWGLAYKAGTDDMRDSPALEVINRLVAAGARVQAYDPAVTVAPGSVELMSDEYDAVRGADVLVVLTEWAQFAEADLQKVRELMAVPRIVDTRNVLQPVVARALGFAYDGLGMRIDGTRAMEIDLAAATEDATLAGLMDVDIDIDGLRRTG
jgi:UDPglucose 6-dehydrogenase